MLHGVSLSFLTVPLRTVCGQYVSLHCRTLFKITLRGIALDLPATTAPTEVTGSAVQCPTFGARSSHLRDIPKEVRLRDGLKGNSLHRNEAARQYSKDTLIGSMTAVLSPAAPQLSRFPASK